MDVRHQSVRLIRPAIKPYRSANWPNLSHFRVCRQLTLLATTHSILQPGSVCALACFAASPAAASQDTGTARTIGGGVRDHSPA